jgi:arsenate reductase
MAEAFLKQLGSDYFEAESSGLEPGELNPTVVEVMKESGIDISGNKTQSVFDLFKSGSYFNAVITVCDEANAERCPIFPGVTQRLAWSFADPASFNGTKEEILQKTRAVRDEIRQQVIAFVKEAKELEYWIGSSVSQGKAKEVM